MFADIYRNKKILVTGHTGFKGSWLVSWLKMLGAEVVGLALAPNTNPNHFELIKTEIESHLIDIRDYELLVKTIKSINPDIIFHLAAQPLVLESYANPLATMNTNVMGTTNLLNASRYTEALKAIVIISTDKCYENKEWNRGYHENDPMGGFDPYSASKGCAELVVSSFRRSYFHPDKHGKEHQVLIATARGGNVIGGGDWSKDRLIPDIVKAAVENKVVNIRSPNSTRPWQHVLECLSGYLVLGQKLLQNKKLFAEAWNFGPLHSSDATVLDVLQLMQQQWSKIQYEIAENVEHPHEANLLKLDCSKANSKLSWGNLWDLKQTIQKTAEWYKIFYEGNNISTQDQIEQYIQVAKQKNIEWAREV